jgi:membrane-associated PAP2 superfamily phosphatase
MNIDSIARSQFWWNSIRWQLAFFVLIAAVFGTTDFDERIAAAVFYDPQQGWLGGSSWWTHQFLHTGGQWLVRVIVLIAIGIWAGSFIESSLEKWRRAAGFVAVSMILSIGSVGLLKHITNVNCPWDLIPFGGHFSYAHLFAHRPPSAHVGRCFPAAHASSGYALFALYFVGREHSRRWARLGFAAGLIAGLIFGLAQQSRGAHFVSHDIWSAMIAWCVPLSLYCFAFSCKLRKHMTQTATAPLHAVAVPTPKS